MMTKFSLPLLALHDEEGEKVPPALPPVVDAHVHLFPDPLFQAIRQWFDQFGWPIRYRLAAPQLVDFLFSRGISHIVALHYAHKPGIARMLNDFMAELCDRYPNVTGTATVFPGEPDATNILEEAFRSGLKGVKLHAHVQFFDLDSDAMHEIYRVCAYHDQPLVMHIGREPKNPDFPYPVDPYVICVPEKVERVVSTYTDLRICVPHLGADHYEQYARMIEQYDNLWLDTTMVYADYLPGNHPPSLAELRPDRVMFGTDFPNIPYSWDRELKKIADVGLSSDLLERILFRNAAEFYSIRI
jgi:predicted TIM-barrel fold metal-dependent hydrolase